MLKCIQPDLCRLRSELIERIDSFIPEFDAMSDQEKLVCILSDKDVFFFYTAKICTKMLYIRTGTAKTNYI